MENVSTMAGLDLTLWFALIGAVTIYWFVVRVKSSTVTTPKAEVTVEQHDKPAPDTEVSVVKPQSSVPKKPRYTSGIGNGHHNVIRGNYVDCEWRHYHYSPESDSTHSDEYRHKDDGRLI